MMERPKIITLCGSTRFYKEYQHAYFEETLKGKIVLSVGFYPHVTKEVHGHNIGITEDQKRMLDELHMRKIDISDEVLILNVGGYIGKSTYNELQHAIKTGKVIRYLEEERWTILS